MTFSIDIVIYLLGLAATAGTILARISALEKKVEKHNGIVERVYKMETRVDEQGKDIDRCFEKIRAAKGESA